MIGAIKSFAQIKRAHVDCRTIRNVGLCHLSYGINSIPAAQMFLKAVLVVSFLEKIRESV